MKKTLKLKKNSEFHRILNKGKYISGKYLDVYLLNTNQDKNYIGLAIGVKIANAVKRNHLKRLIRESYRSIEEKLDTGYQIVFLWKKKINVKEATFQRVQEDMIYVFRKIGILS